MLREFTDRQNIPYPLLSDVDSEIIRRFGILNDEVGPEDAFLYGIPFPGVYVTDEAGVVVAKFFHDTYKKRDSPEMLIDAALGKVVLAEDAPSVSGGDEEVRISVSVHGGKGTIRQGILRQLIVRFELARDVHVYGEPVPEGMVPTSVSVTAPAGLVVEAPIYPPTETLRLESMDMELPVFSGTFDIIVPFYAVGEMASETRPLDVDNAELEINIRYQACNDEICFMPKTEKFPLRLDLDVIDVPALGLHMGHGQRESNFNGMPHLKRMMLRSLKRNPLSAPRFLLKMVRLEIAARWRSLTKS